MTRFFFFFLGGGEGGGVRGRGWVATLLLSNAYFINQNVAIKQIDQRRAERIKFGSL